MKFSGDLKSLMNIKFFRTKIFLRTLKFLKNQKFVTIPKIIQNVKNKVGSKNSDFFGTENNSFCHGTSMNEIPLINETITTIGNFLTFLQKSEVVCGFEISHDYGIRYIQELRNFLELQNFSER